MRLVMLRSHFWGGAFDTFERCLSTPCRRLLFLSQWLQPILLLSQLRWIEEQIYELRMTYIVAMLSGQTPCRHG